MHLQLQNKMKNDQQTRNRKEEYYQEQVQQRKHQDYLERVERTKNNEKQLMYENNLLVQEKVARKTLEKFESIQTDLTHMKTDPYKSYTSAR